MIAIIKTIPLLGVTLKSTYLQTQDLERGFTSVCTSTGTDRAVLSITTNMSHLY